MKLPERTREILGRLIGDLKSRESISSIGLFGSWSRSDAVPSSDTDLLLIDNRDFDYQYVERAEVDNCFLDFNYVPQKWIPRNIPPEIDQKLYEAQVLYDRNSILAKAKDLILKIYWTPERVDMRTETYLLESETYLTRARSAYNKDDFQSANVNAAIGIDALVKILIEVNRLPISNSRFVAAFEDSAEKLGMNKFYEDYVGTTGLSGLDRSGAVNMLNSVSGLWRSAINFIESNPSTLKTLHVKVKNNLNYYGKESFLKAMLIRTKSLIEDELFTEAAHYMFRTSVDMLENYAWLVSIMEGTRFDYSSLFQYLRSSKISPKEIYTKAVEAFGVRQITGREAEESLNKVREMILNIRQKRRELITNHFESKI